MREKPDFVRERLATRNPEFSRLVDEVLKVDSERRLLETELQRLSAERNQLSKAIGALRSKKESSADLPGLLGLRGWGWLVEPSE